MKKAIDHLPITNSTNEDDKPDPIPCKYCGEAKPQLFIEVPGIGNRWVYAACPCEAKEREKFERKQKQLEKNRMIRKLLNLSSEIEKIREYSFENIKVRDGMAKAYDEVKDAVENFEERGSIGLLLFGESGNGKTHLTAAGANELLKRGYSVIFLTEKDLFSRFRETVHFENKERFSEIMKACLEADLLVWDDFMSSQRLSKDEKDWIFQIVNGRADRGKSPIWFTSNITEKEFSNEKYAKILDDKERTWWRIIANNNCVYNRASNYRKLQAIARAEGITPEEVEHRE